MSFIMKMRNLVVETYMVMALIKIVCIFAVIFLYFLFKTLGFLVIEYSLLVFALK